MKQTHTGTCHCGAVRFQFEADLAEGGTRCNCSICTKTDIFARSMKPEAFRLLKGQDDLGTYQWGSKIGTRYFCKNCGVQCYGDGSLEQLGGAFVSVNLNCVDGVELGELKVGYFDGRHNAWQAGTRSKPWPILKQESVVPSS